jgi:hypothetical protein
LTLASNPLEKHRTFIKRNLNGLAIVRSCNFKLTNSVSPIGDWGYMSLEEQLDTCIYIFFSLLHNFIHLSSCSVTKGVRPTWGSNPRPLLRVPILRYLVYLK